MMIKSLCLAVLAIAIVSSATESAIAPESFAIADSLTPESFAVANDDSAFQTATELVQSMTKGGWHLAPDKATSCDFGKQPTKAECSAAVTSLAAKVGKTPGRSMQVGSGGTCGGVGWGGVPMGCVAQSNGDWAAHFKTSGPNCNNGGYQLVCSGHDENACRALASEFEDAVKKNVAALQEIHDKLSTGAHCKDEGQDGIKTAKKARDDAQTALNTAQSEYNSANSASVTIGDYAFNSLTKGQCGAFFQTTNYKNAKAKFDQKSSALTNAKGALTSAENGVTAAEKTAKSLVQQCMCKTYNLHQESVTDANKKAMEENKAGWTKAAHLKCVLDGVSESNCKVPDMPEVTHNSLCTGCDASACSGECATNCLNDKCDGWRPLKTCGLGNVALSAATSWQGISAMKCPEGWHVPTSTEYFNYMKSNGCQGNNAKSSSHGHTYYNQCGWSSYTFAGKSRSMFAFTNSLQGNKPYQHAGNYPGYSGNTGFNTNAFAGWVCMRDTMHIPKGECSAGYHQIGTKNKNNDVAGACMGQTYGQTLSECAAKCEAKNGCVSYMYGPKAQNGVAKGKCELCHKHAPSNSWGTEFYFCRRNVLPQGKCAKGYHQIGTKTKDNDVGGSCLGQTCGKSNEECAASCEANSSCKSYMHGPISQNGACKGKCELCNHEKPNNSWGAEFYFCKKND